MWHANKIRSFRNIWPGLVQSTRSLRKPQCRLHDNCSTHSYRPSATGKCTSCNELEISSGYISNPSPLASKNLSRRIIRLFILKYYIVNDSAV
jgi:hypothetical protein